MFSTESTPFAEENPLIIFLNKPMKNKDNFEQLIKRARELYEKSRDADLEDFPLEERTRFYCDGNRSGFEKLYFKRRDYLSAVALLALFDDGYIGELERVIDGICDEASWVLPAHTDVEGCKKENTVDLFSAETSFALSEISCVFGERLSEKIRNKIKDEIERRLLCNYLNNSFWWEKCKMNWAAVCGGLIAGTLIYLFPDEFLRQRERLLGTIDCYIDGFTEDGFCLEGPSYWLYGFYCFSVFAHLLYNFSEGKENLFSREKTRKIASYGAKAYIKGGCLTFSDAEDNFKCDLALQGFLEEIAGDTVPEIPRRLLGFYEGNTKWISLYRNILWYKDKNSQRANFPFESIYSSESNVLIINKCSYSFAFKGGNNGEPHNHNDLGSFIYSDEKGQVFCDLGSGRYTREYFSDEARYEIFCNSSFSHSVPVIDGLCQSAGEKFTARLIFDGEEALCDMKNAYNLSEPVFISRRAKIKEQGVIITDSFNGKAAITERFVSKRKATEKNGELIFGKTRMKYSPSLATLEIKEEKHTPHSYEGEAVTVYCYDFILKKGTKEISFEIETE